MATKITPKPSTVIETLGAKTSETVEGLRKINNYLLKKEIGRGTFGIVHLGINTITNEQFAIKEFSKSRLRRREKQAMMKKVRAGGESGKIKLSSNPLDLVRSEIAILKKLNHDNVVKLYEVLDDSNGDSLYMVMEMAHKGVLMQIDLSAHATPYTETIARNYFRQIILGIEYLHCNDIVHRDIKPDNILLSENNKIKIVDFGVSEMFVKGNDSLKSMAGSPAFMPPELCNTTIPRTSSGTVSGRAVDIWSMGVTLFCLVHGFVPFSNNDILGLYEMIQCDSVRCNENLSHDLKDLLYHLLQKNPESRISMHDLRNHPWVTNSGKDRLISEQENCQSVQVTEDEIKSAITSVRHIFAVMHAVAKFKRHSKSIMSDEVKIRKRSRHDTLTTESDIIDQNINREVGESSVDKVIGPEYEIPPPTTPELSSALSSILSTNSSTSLQN